MTLVRVWVAEVRLIVAGVTVKEKVAALVAVLLAPVAVKTRLTRPVEVGVPVIEKARMLLLAPEVEVATVAQPGVPVTAQVKVSEGSVELAVTVVEATV